MKKILIGGFIYCGTSILKSIIGHIDEVHEIIDEEYEIIEEKYKVNNPSKKYILVKDPNIIHREFIKKGDELIFDPVSSTNKLEMPLFKDYIIIFIIRNPLYVFSSINKKLDNFSPKDGCHNIEIYLKTIELYCKYIKKQEILGNILGRKDIYLIRYEDLFDNNYSNLKKILNSIGLKYTDDIFDNSKYKNFISSTVKSIPENLPEIKVDNDSGSYKTNQPFVDMNIYIYRTYQINKPFVNNNTGNIYLTKKQLDIFVNNTYVNMIYPEIKDLIPHVILIDE